MRLAPRQCERFKVDCVYKAVPIETVTMTMHIGMVGAGYADSPVGGTSGPGGDAAWAAKGKGKGKPTAMGADPGPYGPPPMLPPPPGVISVVVGSLIRRLTVDNPHALPLRVYSPLPEGCPKTGVGHTDLGYPRGAAPLEGV